MKVYADPGLVKEMAVARREEILALRDRLWKSEVPDGQLDATVRQLAEEAASRVDCVACHNCCMEMTAEATDAEVEAMAALLRISPEQFRERFTMPAPLALTVIRKADPDPRKRTPCILLGKDGGCLVYPARPRACRVFPRLTEGRIRDELWGLAEHCRTCPIVYSVFEELMERGEV